MWLYDYHGDFSICLGQEKKQQGAGGQNNDVQDALDTEEEVQQERVITLRPLNMQDFKEAKSQVRLLYYH